VELLFFVGCSLAAVCSSVRWLARRLAARLSGRSMTTHAHGIGIEEADDHYAVLRVSRTASTAEIRRQYQQLALELHPDKNSLYASGDAVEYAREIAARKDAFDAVQRAWEVLRDAELRRRYDRVLAGTLVPMTRPALDRLLTRVVTHIRTTHGRGR